MTGALGRIEVRTKVTEKSVVRARKSTGNDKLTSVEEGKGCERDESEIDGFLGREGWLRQNDETGSD